MKNILLLLTFLSGIAACSKDEENSDAASILSSTNWRVAHYMDDGLDKTNDFLGYTIQFTATGAITVTNNSVSNSGTWTKNESLNQLILNMGTAVSPVSALTNDWKITTLSSAEVSLYDEVQTSDMLVLMKN